MRVLYICSYKWGGGAKWLILWTSWFTIFPSSVLLCLIFHSSAPHALLLLSFVSTFPSLSLSTLTCCTSFPVNTSPVLVPYCPALHKTQCKPFFFAFVTTLLTYAWTPSTPVYFIQHPNCPTFSLSICIANYPSIHPLINQRKHMTFTAFSINKVKRGDQKLNKSVTFLLKNCTFKRFGSKTSNTT